MTSFTLNSGALNDVPFPGAEEGASLVEMVGTVTVIGALPSLRMRLAAVAAVSAIASTSQASTNIRILLGASTVSEAVSMASAISKTPASLEPSVAQASSSASSVLKAKIGATSTPSAVSAPVESLLNTYRSASASAVAETSAGSIKLASLAASGSGVAATSASALTKRGVTASQSAAAITSSGFAIKYLTPAYGQGQASASCSAYSYLTNGASSTASAVVANAAARIRLKALPAESVALADAKDAGVYLISNLSAVSEAAAPAQAGIAIRIKLGAEVTAGVSATSVAADYAAAAPAPDDRQMFVGASDRYMKVPA